jgi:hypothetical protein
MLLESFSQTRRVSELADADEGLDHAGERPRHLASVQADSRPLLE